MNGKYHFVDNSPALSLRALEDATNLPKAAMVLIAEFYSIKTTCCSRCEEVGQLDELSYIINGCMLWRCTRCAKPFCYYCYEPRDGHLCFADDWIVGAGYGDVKSVGSFFQYLGPKGDKPTDWDEFCSDLLENEFWSDGAADDEEEIGASVGYARSNPSHPDNRRRERIDSCLLCEDIV